MEDVVHHHLEGCWDVHKAKEHDLWLEEPLVGTECSLPLVTLSDSDIVETPSDISLVKYLAPQSCVISSEMSGIG